VRRCTNFRSFTGIESRYDILRFTQIFLWARKHIFHFEAIGAGEAKLDFSYIRVWEAGIPAIKNVVYTVIVDKKNNITLKE
jgi:hypothetical protein